MIALGYGYSIALEYERRRLLAGPQNEGMSSPTRFIKRLVSEQAPREAVVRMDLATRRYHVTFYRHGVKQPELARDTSDEKEAVRWGREFVGADHEAEG